MDFFFIFPVIRLNWHKPLGWDCNAALTRGRGGGLHLNRQSVTWLTCAWVTSRAWRRGSVAMATVRSLDQSCRQPTELCSALTQTHRPTDTHSKTNGSSPRNSSGRISPRNIFMKLLLFYSLYLIAPTFHPSLISLVLVSSFTKTIYLSTQIFLII